MPRNRNNIKNLLDAVPVRCVEWEEKEGDQITLVAPKFQSKRLRQLLIWLQFKPEYSIRLDAFGSFVWRHCDGSKDCHQIGLALKEHFGNDVEPVFDRLGQFFRLLTSRNLVRLDFHQE